MSDLPRRLRDEARRLPSSTDTRLAQRILAALPPPTAALRPLPRSAPLRPLLAAAAVLVALSAGALLLWPQRPATPGAAPAAPLTAGTVSGASLPDLTAILDATPRLAAPANTELSALEQDLTAAARTLRSAVPF
jgi:hypothetical protein